MDINFSDADNQFRQEVKDYLENKYPKHVKEKQNNGEQLTKQDMIDYHKSLYEQGWAGYNWPVEYGGTGWSPTQIYIFQEELGYANTPTILPFGLNMVGPVIYTFGNDEQKKKYAELFEQYFLKSFSSRLAEYTNPEISVEGKKVLSEKYTIVNSLLKGTNERPEIKIDWRIYTKNPDNPLIRDLIIEGLSLARTQKEEFASILSSNNNDINALFKTLEEFSNK